MIITIPDNRASTAGYRGLLQIRVRGRVGDNGEHLHQYPGHAYGSGGPGLHPRLLRLLR